MYLFTFVVIAVQHERKPVSDKIESIQNLSTNLDNNNIPTFSYGNNPFIKNEVTCIKNDVSNFIKTEMPYGSQRSIFNDQVTLHLIQSSSNY